MEYLLLAIIGLLMIVILILVIKLHFMRKSIVEIIEAFQDRLAADTNTLIDISSRDPYVCQLAAAINDQLQLLRKQRHKYLRGDRELKEAVTNISHDLRTPLTAICGYMDLLQKEEKSENVARYLSFIENRVEAMKGLTDELFRYSVILSAGEMKMESVHVNGVLEETIAAFYGALTSRNIHPQIKITDKRIEKQLNRDALTRILENIINNALKYSDGDLEITLQDDGMIVFSNTASRLNDVLVGRLFDRFFTVEAARNSSGLGLSIAKNLVEQMNGTIAASYRDGKLSITVQFS